MPDVLLLVQGYYVSSSTEKPHCPLEAASSPVHLTDNPLVKPCLVFLSMNRNAINQRSSGRSGQAEMPCCIGVTPTRQVVPG